ncbi:MAG: hypothetical protein KAJ48_08995, partial [Elusimicrobiales bacterium]|nr:hypothetical protein [Elusimicrobiales bacterium]
MVVIVMFSMLAMYAYMPMVQADSMDSAKTTLSDSDIDATATSTIVVNLGTAITVGQYIRVTYESDFRNFVVIPATACPVLSTASSTGTSNDWRVIECVATTTIAAATSTIVIQHQNPSSESDYSVTISTHEVNGTEIESSETKVYILNDVEVTATVPATLTFGVDLLGMNSTRNTINGVALTGSSTETALAFGTLNDTSSSTLGHELSVSTNASG